jgi:uncharacterized protein
MMTPFPAEGASGHAAEGSLFFRFVLPILALAILSLAGCGKKSISKSEIRAVTDEIVAAADRVAGRKIPIEIQPVSETLQTGALATTNQSYNIYVSLAAPAQASQLQQALAEIARRHKLDFSDTVGPGVLRVYFSRDGVRTHSIHIISPLAVRPRPPVIARAHPQGSGGLLLAIIIDDMGRDRASADAVLALPFPLTLSILPHLPFSAETAEEAHSRGDEVLLHLPMEPEPGSTGGPDGVAQEPVELRVGMTAEQVNWTLAGMLDTVPLAAGVNNHEGSRATADPALMHELMVALRQHNLFFIDSRTTAATVAYAIAEQDGVPAASRKVFLDDVPTKDAVLAQLDQAARDAQRDGSAIAIGHPHPATIAALAQGVPRLESRGLRLVFPSDLVQ